MFYPALATLVIAIGSLLGVNAEFHYVTVGKGGHAFEPDSIEAQVGDIVSFQFYPLNHSVIRAAYGYPCIPIETLGNGGEAFFSGFYPVAAITGDPPTWNYKVEYTDPIFYYCGAPGSCTDWAMLGVINPNSSTSLKTQQDLAKQADFMLLPGEPFPTEEQQMSLSKLAHTATETETVTAGPTQAPAQSSVAPHPHPGDDDHGESSGLSTGAVAGIAVGAAVVALVLAALFILMRRTKKLKRKLDDEKAQSQANNQSGAPPMSSNVYGNYYDQNRPHSQLPPYHQNPTVDAYMYDANKPEGWNGDQSPRGRMSPPLPGQQHMGVLSPNPNQRYSQATTSEMQGNRGPAVELDNTFKR